MTKEKSSPPEGEAPKKKKPLQKKGYKVTEWNGHPNYECDECPFSTLDEVEMVRHIRKNH